MSETKIKTQVEYALNSIDIELESAINKAENLDFSNKKFTDYTRKMDLFRQFIISPDKKISGDKNNRFEVQINNLLDDLVKYGRWMLYYAREKKNKENKEKYNLYKKKYLEKSEDIIRRINLNETGLTVEAKERIEDLRGELIGKLIRENLSITTDFTTKRETIRSSPDELEEVIHNSTPTITPIPTITPTRTKIVPVESTYGIQFTNQSTALTDSVPDDSDTEDWDEYISQQAERLAARKKAATSTKGGKRNTKKYKNKKTRRRKREKSRRRRRRRNISRD